MQHLLQLLVGLDVEVQHFSFTGGQKQIQLHLVLTLNCNACQVLVGVGARSSCPCMMAEDGSLRVMHPATALMSVSLVGGMVSVIMSSATLTTHYSTHDSSALGDCSVAGTKVSCYTTITTSSVNTARYICFCRQQQLYSCRSWLVWLGWVDMLIGLCHNLSLPWALVRCWA